jgi:hypothetical protein
LPDALAANGMIRRWTSKPYTPDIASLPVKSPSLDDTSLSVGIAKLAPHEAEREQ